MSDHERGAYTPPTDSAPLAFEARQPVRGARPFPLTLVVSVMVLLGLAAAIFVFYRQGARQSAGPPQAVGAPVGGLKTAAPPDAQPQDAAAGLEIYRSEDGKSPQMVPTPPQFTPPPEQPQARPQGGPAVIVAPPPPGPVSQSAAPPATMAPPQPVLRPSHSPPPPAAAPAPKPAATPPPKAAAPAKPAEKPVEKPKPAAAKPAAVKPAPEKAAEKPAPAKSGAAAVQIGAVSSTQLADTTWNDAVALAPGLAAGKGKGVEKVDKDGKTLYRTSVTGFASKADAQTFCAKLKAAGKACFVK